MKSYMRYNDDVFDGRPGKIYLFDFNKPNDPIKELAIEGNVDLVNSGPHGIGLWEDKKGVLDTPTADTAYIQTEIQYKTGFWSQRY